MRVVEDLPPELDFFKYAQGGSAKRKTAHSDVEADEKEGESREASRKKAKFSEEPSMAGPSKTRHRVTAKGKDVPDPIESFEELSSRYNVSSRISHNLADSGFVTPTAIQAHAVPIILEVLSINELSPSRN